MRRLFCTWRAPKTTTALPSRGETSRTSRLEQVAAAGALLLAERAVDPLRANWPLPELPRLVAWRTRARLPADGAGGAPPSRPRGIISAQASGWAITKCGSARPFTSVLRSPLATIAQRRRPTLLGGADALCEDHGLELQPAPGQGVFDELRGDLGRELGEERYEALVAEGRQLT